MISLVFYRMIKAAIIVEKKISYPAKAGYENFSGL
jgi:hypothetical protein